MVLTEIMFFFNNKLAKSDWFSGLYSNSSYCFTVFGRISDWQLWVCNIYDLLQNREIHLTHSSCFPLLLHTWGIPGSFWSLYFVNCFRGCVVLDSVSPPWGLLRYSFLIIIKAFKFFALMVSDMCWFGKHAQKGKSKSRISLSAVSYFI